MTVYDFVVVQLQLTKNQCMYLSFFSPEQCTIPKWECIVMWKKSASALLFLICTSTTSYYWCRIKFSDNACTIDCVWSFIFISVHNAQNKHYTVLWMVPPCALTNPTMRYTNSEWSWVRWRKISHEVKDRRSIQRGAASHLSPNAKSCVIVRI